MRLSLPANPPKHSKQRDHFLEVERDNSITGELRRENRDGRIEKRLNAPCSERPGRIGGVTFDRKIKR